MAIQLFKLVMSAVTTTTTTTNPAVEKYFYELAETERVDDIITIPSTLFTDDAGTVLTENLTTVTEDDGYYQLFINGVLQQTSLYTVSGDGSQIVITDAESVPVGAPIILVVTNFAPTSTSTTTITS